jgi:hypothetical protein
MKSLQYFQPMVHVPLLKIDSIFRLAKPIDEYLIYRRPVGIDVYITGGKIYDFNHRELLNNTLRFNLEKALMTSMQTQGLYIGTLCCIAEPTKIIKYRPLLYMSDNLLPLSARFLVYDVIFPYFKVDNPFWCRYDIAKKTVGVMPGCSCMEIHSFKTFKELKYYVKDKFDIGRYTGFIVFDKYGQYHDGIRQLTYSPHEQVSFELSASQKYRSHIRKILPVDIEISEGRTVTIAGSIEARFKSKPIIIPITMPNYILRKNLWDHRKELKRTPFVFEGIYFEEDNVFEILGLHYSKFLL